MDIKNQITCPLCGCNDCRPYMKCTDYTISHEQYDLAQCTDCKVVFTQNPPSDNDLENYDKVSIRQKLGDKPEGLVNRLYYHMRSAMLPRKARIVERQAYRNSGTLLNYGAKTGFFSSVMEKRGWNVTSVEKYHEERVFSLEMFHHRMIDLHEMSLLHEQSFDVITLWHVFEHNGQPGQLLDRFYSLLRPNGILIMACPNICSADAAHYGPYWAAYDVPRHLWHFNPESICNLAGRHGFTLMHHEPLPYDCFYISILSERHMGHRLPFLRGMAKGFRFWCKSLSKRGQSSSLVYVFRKK